MSLEHLTEVNSGVSEHDDSDDTGVIANDTDTALVAFGTSQQINAHGLALEFALAKGLLANIVPSFDVTVFTDSHSKVASIRNGHVRDSSGVEIQDDV